MPQLAQTSTVFPMKNGCYQNNKILKGKGAMPGHYYPSSGDTMFSLNRRAYTRTANNTPKTTLIPNKPIQKQDASSRTMMLRINAIGKSSVNVKGDTLGFSSLNKNTVNRALSKVRNKGCVAPAKKGYYPRH
jgi:hypothetical protein